MKKKPIIVDEKAKMALLMAYYKLLGPELAARLIGCAKTCAEKRHVKE